MPEVETATAAKSIDVDVWRLLPWLANDTLDGDDLERVLDHLKSSSRCREELLFLSELRFAVEMSCARPPGDSLDAPEDRLPALMDRINAHERRTAAPAPRHRPAAVAWASAAAVVVLVAGWVWWSVAGSDAELRVSPSRFETLSSVESQTVVTPRLRLVPASGVAEEDLRALILELEAQIVGGPTAAGVYTLGWRSDEDSTSPRSDLAEKRSAARLRSDGRVALAEEVRP